MTEDHDILIEVANDVKNICKKQDKMEQKLDDHIAKDNTFLTKKMYMWLMGLFFSLVCGAYVFAWGIDGEFDKHAQDIGIHHETKVIEALKE